MSTRNQPAPTERLDADAFADAVRDAPEATLAFDVRGLPVTLVASGTGMVKKPLDHGRIHTFEDVKRGAIGISPLDPAPPELTRREAFAQSTPPPAQDKELSRWVRRGLETHHPLRLYLSALCILVSRFLFFIVTFVTPVLLVLDAVNGTRHLWTFLPVIGAFIVFGLIHLLAASRLRCRVCSCHLLIARRCHKNIKAHPRFPMGYVGSAALHAILFRWFRCMYCGTPMMLSKRTPNR